MENVHQKYRQSSTAKGTPGRFVSRACGFVAVYDDISVSVRPDADNWIQDLVLIDTLVQFNNRIHLKALH